MDGKRTGSEAPRVGGDDLDLDSRIEAEPLKVLARALVLELGEDLWDGEVFFCESAQGR